MLNKLFDFSLPKRGCHNCAHKRVEKYPCVWCDSSSYWEPKPDPKDEEIERLKRRLQESNRLEKGTKMSTKQCADCGEECPGDSSSECSICGRDVCHRWCYDENYCACKSCITALVDNAKPKRK